MIQIAILGYGTVGSGVYEIIKKNQASIAKKAGDTICVSHILDIRDFNDHPEKHLFTKNFDDILEDDAVSVVVEVMGGVEPAYSFTKAALLRGKNVVTSNKELVATHGTELIRLAKENHVNYFFEASVGGGIPIIRPMNQCLAANNIQAVYGILNGTTNYILTKMFEEGVAFSEALLEAQALGYAERNPEADVEGHDACRKTAILASLATGKFVDYKEIPTEGITKITITDVQMAEKIGYVIKLIGAAEMDDSGKVSALVAPRLVPKESQLSGVRDVFNAIMLRGDSLGDVMFYGRGAGKLPTASAVCADVIDAAKHLHTNKWVIWDAAEETNMLPKEEQTFRYFVRTTDAELADKFPVASIVGEQDGELVFTTKEMTEADFMALAEGKCNFIRIL